MPINKKSFLKRIREGANVPALAKEVAGAIRSKRQLKKRKWDLIKIKAQKEYREKHGKKKDFNPKEGSLADAKLYSSIRKKYEQKYKHL